MGYMAYMASEYIYADCKISFFDDVLFRMIRSIQNLTLGSIICFAAVRGWSFSIRILDCLQTPIGLSSFHNCGKEDLGQA